MRTDFTTSAVSIPLAQRANFTTAEVMALHDQLARVTVQRGRLAEALWPFVIPEVAVCQCRPWGHGGPVGGGGSRDAMTGQWVNGQHATDCPQMAARAALATLRAEGGAK